MARTREVGSLWIGGALSWFEQLCLKSFVDKGQKITLFSYEDIPNVPEGVIRCDGREIIDTDDFIKYEHKDSFALFADLFRLHMIARRPGMIWVDTDIYCHRPLDYDSDYVFGYELTDEHRINNAVLGMPADSALLQRLLDFTADRFSIPPFLPPKQRATMREAADRGEPVHVSQQPWGVWGPWMLTHFVHEMGLARHALPQPAFYPVTFPDRTKFFRAARAVAREITVDTTGLHLWSSNKKGLGGKFGGLPPKGSYLDKLARKHGIRPALAPIETRGRAFYDSTLVEALDLAEVNTVADLTGAARGFLLALSRKFDCAIRLVNIDPTGGFPEAEQNWIGKCRRYLLDNGVEPDRITVIASEAALRPVDVLCNLGGFGDRHKVKFLAPVLDRCLHADSRLFMDVRDGSGAFPFIKDWGTNTPLATWEDKVKMTRICLTPKPPAIGDIDESWGRIATQLAGEDGWYRSGPEGHSLLFMPRSSETLVVTFDNLDIAMNKRDDRRPWGYSFIKEQGWSMLGVLAGGWTWYRQPWVEHQFNELKASGFFDRFGRVVLYGASMGAYAACAFSAAVPGCDVVAISPQSTLDKTVVPWESRYKVAWARDFSGPYGDAAEASRSARRVSLIYDPFEALDARHVARFVHPNVQKLRTPFLGHRLGSSLSQMGILTPIILGALTGSLTDRDFYRMLRSRRASPRYQRELFNRAVAQGHTALARAMGERVLTWNPNRAISRGLNEMAQSPGQRPSVPAAAALP